MLAELCLTQLFVVVPAASANAAKTMLCKGQIGLTAAFLAVATVLSGCNTCERSAIADCGEKQIANTHAICGVTEYSNVFNGQSSVRECCEALKELQDCYTACPCDTACDPRDLQYCPTTGKINDVANFYAAIMGGLEKDSETCASVGVPALSC